MVSRVLVTGASGWIGSALCQTLLAGGHRVIGVTRQPGSLPAGIDEWHCARDDFLDLENRWESNLRIDIVVHLAARVHAMSQERPAESDLYDLTNRVGSVRLARLAARNGASRFVFLSSIKALGERDYGTPLREDGPARPEDPYGVSKRRAEEELRLLRDIETVIVRAPLVYGPGVRANFLRLLTAVARGWPLPLGLAHAPRTLVALDNLTDALRLCAFDRRAAGQTFHVADRETLSVRDLLLHVGTALVRPARLIPVPLALLAAAAGLLGRRAEIARLTTPLRVDTSHILDVLDWRAPLSIDAALLRTAAWYRGSRAMGAPAGAER